MEFSSLESKYVKKKFIGKGSFGQVYKAIDIKTSKLVAIKVIDNVNVINEDVVISEAKAMEKIVCDNTVPLLNYCYDNGVFQMVMPYYKNGNLQPLIEKQWSKQDILLFLYQMCEAFLSIQSAYFWHLDLKPQNILLQNQCRFLICDFGCAKFIEGTVDKTTIMRLTQQKGKGTTQYGAPQILFDMSGTKYSDIWSLGIILYYILYKTHPFIQKRVTKNLNQEQIRKYLKKLQSYCDSKVSIEFKKLEKMQNIIEMCKQMLKPKKRLKWKQLKQKIYQDLHLNMNTPIISSSQKFINYLQNSADIVLGLVYYIDLNFQKFQNAGLEKEAQTFISFLNIYIYILIDRGSQCLVEGQTNSEDFYIFDKVKKQLTYHEIKKLEYIAKRVSQFTLQDYQRQGKILSKLKIWELNITLGKNCCEFLENIKNCRQLITQSRNQRWQKKGYIFSPISQWHKIQQISKFLSQDSKTKKVGLCLSDSIKIQKFSKRIKYS